MLACSAWLPRPSWTILSRHMAHTGAANAVLQDTAQPVKDMIKTPPAAGLDVTCLFSLPKPYQNPVL